MKETTQCYFRDLHDILFHELSAAITRAFHSTFSAAATESLSMSVAQLPLPVLKEEEGEGKDQEEIVQAARNQGCSGRAPPLWSLPLSSVASTAVHSSSAFVPHFHWHARRLRVNVSSVSWSSLAESMASFRGEMRGEGKEEDEVEEREEEEGGGGDAFVLPCGGAAVDCRLREEGKSYLVLLSLLSERREAEDGGGKEGRGGGRKWRERRKKSI